MVARPQRKWNPLLHLHGQTEHFYPVEKRNKNNKNGMYCCVSMVTRVTGTRHIVMLYVQYTVDLFCLSLFT